MSVKNVLLKDFDQNSVDSIPVIIVGNKCDLESQRVVTTAEGRRVNMILLLQVSSEFTNMTKFYAPYI